MRRLARRTRTVVFVQSASLLDLKAKRHSVAFAAADLWFGDIVQ